MAAGLPRDLIAEFPQSVGKIVSAHVARQSHAVKTSSLTKCKRMIFGTLSGSK
jgi:hypothetical protein